MTRDPELRKTTSDMSVVTFTLAIDGRPGRDGKSNTSFIPCQAWSNTADNVHKFTHKGSLVAVDGRLQQRTYVAKDSRKVSVIEVVCDSVQFLETKRDSSVRDEDDSEFSTKADAPVEGIDTSDDDLPF